MTGHHCSSCLRGTSVIIPRRECMQTLQRHLKQKKNK